LLLLGYLRELLLGLHQELIHLLLALEGGLVHSVQCIVSTVHTVHTVCLQFLLPAAYSILAGSCS
jgi:hypothetical protein